MVCRTACFLFVLNLEPPRISRHDWDFWLSKTWNEPEHDKTNKMTCAPSKDSDQSESSLSAWRSIGSQATHKAHSEDWSDWADAWADQGLLWVHRSFYLFCHAPAHIKHFLQIGIMKLKEKTHSDFYRGARWLSGRVSDSGARGRGFDTYRRRVVSLSKTLYSPKVLVNYPGSGGSVPTWLKNCWLGR